jgi:uncharacterized membrane protein
MIPGLTSKLSEAVVASAAIIDANTDVIRLTGTTSIATITPSFGGGFSGILILIPTAGAVNLLNTGNIATAVTVANGIATILIYSKVAGKWYPGALS